MHSVLVTPILTAVLIVALLLVPPRKKKTIGPFVAEVWLDWGICRGSTLYRQSFRSALLAAVFAKLYAIRIDWALPKYWRSTDYWGKPTWLRHEFAIRFGVRRATEREQAAFAPIYSPVLPGDPNDTGERAQSHPLLESRIDRDPDDLLI